MPRHIDMNHFDALFKYRWLMRNFLVRELRGRYAGSVLGLAWAFVHPLVMLAVYALLFEAVFKVRVAESHGQPFVVYVALAMWPWLAFADGLSRGTQAVVGNAALVKKVAFPHVLLIYAAVVASFVVHGAGYVLVLLIIGALGYHIAWGGLVWAAALYLLLLLFCIGLATAFACIQAFVRDFEQLLAQSLTVLFYLTPILYPIALVPDYLRTAMEFNPLVHLIQPMREALLTGAQPGGMAWLLVATFAVAALGVGHWMLGRLSPYFEDVS